jgi:hypothetical protein
MNNQPDEQDARDGLVDYIVFAHDRLTELLDDLDFPDTWHTDELRDLSEAADQFADVHEICRRRHVDRRLCDEAGIDFESRPQPDGQLFTEPPEDEGAP